MTVLFPDLADAIDEQLHNEYKDYWINFWIAKQQIAIVEQDKNFSLYKQFWDKGLPYAGEFGALFSYKLTPTSIGTDVSIRCNMAETKESNPWVNISADNW